jgi:hypothetical protein
MFPAVVRDENDIRGGLSTTKLSNRRQAEQESSSEPECGSSV